MFIGIKKTKRGDRNKVKSFYLLWVPFIKVKLKGDTKTIKLLGIVIYNSLEGVQVGVSVDNEYSFRAVELELLIKAVSKNLREFKRFENQLIRKFPDLKDKA